MQRQRGSPEPRGAIIFAVCVPERCVPAAARRYPQRRAGDRYGRRGATGWELGAAAGAAQRNARAARERERPSHADVQF
eukprot:4663968-Prymnesium_polylepis.1